MRSSVLKSIEEYRELSDTLIFNHTIIDTIQYVSMGNSINLITGLFKVENGVQQGAIEGRWFYSMGYRKAFEKLYLKCVEVGG